MPMVNDASLPGAGIAMDANVFLDVLRRELDATGSAVLVEGGNIQDIQYAPRKSCAVLYKLKVREGADSRSARALVAVRALTRGAMPPPLPEGVERRYRERLEDRASKRLSPLPWALLHLPQADLAVYSFPVDPAMPWLMDVMNPEGMCVHLSQAWSARGSRVRRVAADVLAYTPEQRLAMRLEVLAESRRTMIPELRHLVGKVHVRRPPERLFSGAWALFRTVFGRVRIAPPVGYLATHNLSLQEFVGGERLSDLAGSGTFSKSVRQAAYALGVVHSTQLPLASYRTPEKEIKVVQRWVDVLSALRTDQARRVARLGEQIIAELESRFRLTGTVHSDFHLANMLVDRDGVCIIDWDQIAHGDCMCDVGRFLGALRVSALRISNDPHALKDIGEEFLSTYLAQTGEDERRARLFESASLLIAAAGPFRLQRHGWEEGAALLIDEAERTFEQAMQGSAVPGAAAPERSLLPLQQRLAWAADGVYAQSQILPWLREQHGDGLEIASCKVIRLQPYRHTHRFAYVLRGFLDSQPWQRTVIGHVFSQRRGRSAYRRLVETRMALEEAGAALGLPGPVGHVDTLLMLLTDPVVGMPLIRMLGEPAINAMLDRVVEALTGLQATRVGFTKTRTVETELDSMRARVSRLSASENVHAPRAQELFDRIADRLGTIEADYVLDARDTGIHRLVLAGDRIETTVAGDLLHMHRLSASARIISQLLRMDATKPRGGRQAADYFRARFLQVTGADAAALALFEALALLAFACRLARLGRREARVGWSLSMAEAAMDVAEAHA